MNNETDQLLEDIKKAKWEFEESDRQVTRARVKKDKKIKELSKTLEALYSKNLDLVKKLKEYAK